MIARIKNRRASTGSLHSAAMLVGWTLSRVFNGFR